MLRIAQEQLDTDLDLRVSYNGAPFTGIAFGLGPGGYLQTEMEYLDGWETGRTRWWYPSGLAEYEIELRDGVLHGESRHWHANGKLEKWARGEFGISLEEKEWSYTGELLRHFVLTEDHPLWRILQQYREQDKLIN